MFKIFKNRLSVLAAVVFLAGASCTYVAGTNMIETQRGIESNTTYRVMNNRLFISLLDAETGQRGFLMTGKEEYLDPYHQGATSIPGYLMSYERRDLNPDQRAFFQAIHPLIDAKLAELDQSITARRTHGYAAAMQVVETREGKVVMDQIRRQFYFEQDRANSCREILQNRAVLLTQATLYAIFVALIGLLMMWISVERD